MNPLLAAVPAEPLPAGNPLLRPTPITQETDALISPYDNELVKGLRRGAVGVSSGSMALGAAIEDMFNREQAAKDYAAAQALQQKILSQNPAATPTLRDINGVQSAIDYAAGGFGEAMPTMLAALAGGVVGRRFAQYYAPNAFRAGGLLPEMAGGAAGVFPQEAGETALTLSQDPAAMQNTTPGERLGLSAGKGLINSLAESYVPAALGSKLTLNNLAKVPAGSRLKHIAIEGLKGGRDEAATEAFQELTGVLAHQQANPNVEVDPWDIADAAAKGFIPGKVFGATGGAVDALTSPAQGIPGMAANAAAAIPGAAKAAAKATGAAANDSVKALAGAINNLPDMPSSADEWAGAADDVDAAMAARLKNIEAKGGELAADAKTWMAPVASYFKERGWNSPEGTLAGRLLDALEKDGISGFNRFTQTEMDQFKAIKDRALSESTIIKNDPVASETKKADDFSNLGSPDFSKSTRGRKTPDIANKTIREELQKLLLPKDIEDAIADQISMSTVLLNGKPNVNKTVEKAVERALNKHISAEKANLIPPSMRKKLAAAVRDKVAPKILEQFDSMYPHVDPDSMRQMYEGVVKTLYGDKVTPQHLEVLTGQYANLTHMLAQGTISARAVHNKLSEQFGANASAAVQQLEAIADVIYGKDSIAATETRKFSARQRQFESILKETAKIATPEGKESHVAMLNRMNSDMTRAYDIASRVKNDGKNNPYDRADAYLKAAWMKNGITEENFPKMLKLLEQFRDSDQRISNESIGKIVLEEKGKGVKTSRRVSEESAKHAHRVTMDGDERSNTIDLGGDTETQGIGHEENREEADRRNDTELSSGITAVTDAPIFHGVGILRDGKHDTNVVQAPLTRHPSADYEHGEYNQAVENAHAVYGHRVADTEEVNMWQWAAEESQRSGKSEYELLNEAMNALLAHDKDRLVSLTKRAKTDPQAEDDIQWIESRVKDAEKAREIGGDQAGSIFFDPEGPNRHYRYYRMKPHDMSNVRFNLNQLQKIYGPRFNETHTQYLERIAKQEGHGTTDEAAVVSDSMIPLRTTDGKLVWIDFPKLLRNTLRGHQQADVEGVADSLRELGLFDQSKDLVKDIDKFLDPLGDDKDNAKLIKDHGEFNKALVKAVNFVLSTLWLTTGVTEVAQGNNGEGFQKGKIKNATKERNTNRGGLNPNTVVWRNLADGTVLRYSDISTFLGVKDGTVVFKKGPPGMMDTTGIVLEASKSAQTNAANKAKRGIAVEAVGKWVESAGKKKFVKFDLNLHELLNNILARYGIDHIAANNDTLMPTSLAAVLLNEGFNELRLHGYTVNLQATGEQDASSFYDSVMIFKGYKPEGQGRYDITFGRIRDMITNLKEGTKKGGEILAEASGKDLEGSKQMKAKKDAAKYLQEIHDTIQKVITLREKGMPSPALERIFGGKTSVKQMMNKGEMQERLARIEKLIGESDAFDPTNVARGEVGDGQIDVNAGRERYAVSSGSLGDSTLTHSKRVTKSGDAQAQEAINNASVPEFTSTRKPQSKTIIVESGTDMPARQGPDLVKKEGLKKESGKASVVNRVEAQQVAANTSSKTETPVVSTHGEDRGGSMSHWKATPKAQVVESETNAPELRTLAQSRAARLQAEAWRNRELPAKHLAQQTLENVEAGNTASPKQAKQPVAKKAEVKEETKEDFSNIGSDPFSKSTRGAGNPSQRTALENALKEELSRILGDLVGVDLVDEIVDPATGEKAAGQFFKDGDVEKILVAIGMSLEKGTLHHEIWHKVESMLAGMGKQGQEVLDTVYKHVMTPMMVAWLDRTLTELGDHGAITQLMNTKNPEKERAAYVFQLYMEGRTMPLNGETKGIWNKLKNFVAKVLAKIGITTTNGKQRTEAFFKYLNDGGFLRDYQNPVAVLTGLGKTRTDTFTDSLKEATKPIMDGIDVVFGSTVNRLRKYGIKEYMDLIKLYSGDSGKGGYLGAVDAGINKWGAVASNLLKGMNEAERKNFAGTPAFYNDFVPKFGAYLESRGLSEEEIQSVYDNLASFDIDKANKNFEHLVSDIEHHSGMKDMTPGKAREIAQIIVDNGFYDSEGKGKLFDKAPEIARKWESTDAKDYMARLIYTGVKKAEYKAAFYKDGVNMYEKLKKAGDSKANNEARNLADKVMASYAGVLGAGTMTQAARQLTGVLLTANNIRTLPFAVFAQIIEPLQLALRKNDLSGVMDSLWRGIKDARRTFDTFNKNAEKDYWENLAEEIGSVASDIMGETLGSLYNGVKTNGAAGWLNDKFFKYNFMSQWNRSMHIAATKHAVEFLKDHAIGKVSNHSERFLSELNITEADVRKVMRSDGSFDMSKDETGKVARAMKQYVDEAMAHPDAGSNALWMNDPRFALFAHMKRFSFSFSTYVLGRAINEIKHGNYFPLLPTVIAIPWMLTSDAVRDLVKPGDEAYKANWDAMDYLTRGVERTGALGKFNIPYDAIKAQTMGGNAIEALLGPSAEMVGNGLRFAQGK